MGRNIGDHAPRSRSAFRKTGCRAGGRFKRHFRRLLKRHRRSAICSGPIPARWLRLPLAAITITATAKPSGRSWLADPLCFDGQHTAPDQESRRGKCGVGLLLAEPAGVFGPRPIAMRRWPKFMSGVLNLNRRVECVLRARPRRKLVEQLVDGSYRVTPADRCPSLSCVYRSHDADPAAR